MKETIGFLSNGGLTGVLAVVKEDSLAVILGVHWCGRASKRNIHRLDVVRAMLDGGAAGK